MAMLVMTQSPDEARIILLGTMDGTLVVVEVMPGVLRSAG